MFLVEMLGIGHDSRSTSLARSRPRLGMLVATRICLRLSHHHHLSSRRQKWPAAVQAIFVVVEMLGIEPRCNRDLSNGSTAVEFFEV